MSIMSAVLAHITAACASRQDIPDNMVKWMAKRHIHCLRIAFPGLLEVLATISLLPIWHLHSTSSGQSQCEIMQ